MKSYPEAYLKYLSYFHGPRDYFECHEVLEEYWKDHPDSPYRETWVGLIQVAVALYHQRRGNMRGAQKMISIAFRILRSADLSAIGIDGERFMLMIYGRLEQITANPEAPFLDLNIPVADPKLIPFVKSEESGSPDPFIVHKHMLRDRSDVIAARDAELQKRRTDRQERSL